MAHNYGAVGIATVNSAGAVGSGTVRVFDVLMVNETNGAKITVYDTVIEGGALGTSAVPYITVGSGLPSMHSNAGIRFNKGCFVGAAACTAVVSYIVEF